MSTESGARGIVVRMVGAGVTWVEKILSIRLGTPVIDEVSRELYLTANETKQLIAMTRILGEISYNSTFRSNCKLVCR